MSLVTIRCFLHTVPSIAAISQRMDMITLHWNNTMWETMPYWLMIPNLPGRLWVIQTLLSSNPLPKGNSINWIWISNRTNLRREWCWNTLRIHYATHDTRLTHGNIKLRLAEDFEMLRLTMMPARRQPDVTYQNHASGVIFCDQASKVSYESASVMVTFTWKNILWCARLTLP